MLNPVGLLTFYLFRVIGVGDVPKRWFVNRKLNRCIVQGPGVLAFAGIAEAEGSSFIDCSFKSCDFIVVAEGAYSNTAYPIDGVKAKHVIFDNCTFLVTDDFYQHLKRNLTEKSEEANRIEGAMPAFLVRQRKNA